MFVKNVYITNENLKKRHIREEIILRYFYTIDYLIIYINYYLFKYLTTLNTA